MYNGWINNLWTYLVVSLSISKHSLLSRLNVTSNSSLYRNSMLKGEAKIWTWCSPGPHVSETRSVLFPSILNLLNTHMIFILQHRSYHQDIKTEFYSYGSYSGSLVRTSGTWYRSLTGCSSSIVTLMAPLIILKSTSRCSYSIQIKEIGWTEHKTHIFIL